MQIPRNYAEYMSMYPTSKEKYSLSLSGNWLIKNNKQTIKKIINFILDNAPKVEGFRMNSFQKIDKFDFEKVYQELTNKEGVLFFGKNFEYSINLHDRYVGGELHRTDKQISLYDYRDIINTSKIIDRINKLYEIFPTNYCCFTIKIFSQKEYRPLEIYGKWYIENKILDKEKLLKIPAYKIEKLPDGGILVQHDKDIFNYSSLFKRFSYWRYQRALKKCFIPWEEQVKKMKERDKELGVTVRMVPESEIGKREDS